MWGRASALQVSHRPSAPSVRVVPKARSETRSNRVLENVARNRLVSFNLAKDPIEIRWLPQSRPRPHPPEGIPGVLLPRSDERPQLRVWASACQQKMHVVGHEAVRVYCDVVVGRKCQKPLTYHAGDLAVHEVPYAVPRCDSNVIPVEADVFERIEATRPPRGHALGAGKGSAGGSRRAEALPHRVILQG